MVDVAIENIRLLDYCCKKHKMECIFGIQFKNFVLLGADMSNIQGIVVMKTDENKLYKIGEKLVMALCGDSGDITNFVGYIRCNFDLYKVRNKYEMSPRALATYTRGRVAEALRSAVRITAATLQLVSADCYQSAGTSQTPVDVSLLLAGYDNETGPILYYIDDLGTKVEVSHACHGFGGLFALSIMDRYRVEEMTEEAAYEIAVKCVKEIQQRFVVNLPKFKIQVIDKNGIKDMPDITADTVAAASAGTP